MINKNYLPESIESNLWKSFSKNIYDNQGSLIDRIDDDSKLYFTFIENNFICDVLLDFSINYDNPMVEISINNREEEFNEIRVSKVFPFSFDNENKYYTPIKNWSNNTLYLLLEMKEKINI